MNDDLISRKAAIDALGERPMVWSNDDDYALGERNQYDMDKLAIETVPPAQPGNQVNLCDSCKHTYPDCPSQNDDVIFGNGNGDDNICACAKYAPSAQPEIIRCKECRYNIGLSKFIEDYYCCDYHEHIVRADDFCSDAERREEGDE